MPFYSSRGGSGADGADGTSGLTTGEITLAVAASGGSDSDSASRTPTLTEGDFSAAPFSTMSAALASVMKLLGDVATIQVGAGTFTGARVSSFLGSGLTIEGTFAVVTPTSGDASGTCGSGTNSTTVVKPTGASDWTADDFLGKFLKVVVSGETYYRAIQANTTTTLTVPSVTGMDNTATFQIVDVASILTEILTGTHCLEVSYCQSPITIRGFAFDSAGALQRLIKSYGNNSVTIDACAFDFATVADSIDSIEDGSIRVTNCVIRDAVTVNLEKAAKLALVDGCYLDAAGPIYFKSDISKFERLVSVNAASYVIHAEGVDRLQGECDASDGGATPFYFDGIGTFEAIGANKLTGSGNTGYGIQIENGGLFLLAGCDVTGTSGDTYVASNAVTWANLNSGSYGSAEANGIAIVCNPAGAKALVYGNKLFFGSMDISGRALLYGYLNVSSNLSVPTFTGSESYNMESNGVRCVLECICNSASASVTLPSGAAIAGVIVGIVNRGSQDLTVVPPGSGTVNGTTSDTVAAGTSKFWVSLNGNSGNDFWSMT